MVKAAMLVSLRSVTLRQQSAYIPDGWYAPPKPRNTVNPLNYEGFSINTWIST
jgi:hypothetical protein